MCIPLLHTAFMVETGWWVLDGGFGMVGSRWWVQDGGFRMVGSGWWVQDGGVGMVGLGWWGWDGGFDSSVTTAVSLSLGIREQKLE